MVFVILTLAGAGCSLRSSGPSTTIDPGLGVAPTQAALDADEVMRQVPSGYVDCGTTVLSSGWPSTTAYVSEQSAACIVEAASAGSRAQHAYTHRDHAGGIEGTIIRVEGSASILMLTYHIDDQGNATTTDVTCEALDVPQFEPPVCTDGE